VWAKAGGTTLSSIISQLSALVVEQAPAYSSFEKFKGINI